MCSSDLKHILTVREEGILLQEIFILAFTLIFVSEIGDKTQLAALALVAQFRRPSQILLGCMLGFLIIDGLSAFLGELLYYTIDGRLLRFVSAALFLILASHIAAKKLDTEQAASKKGARAAVLTSILTIMLLEFGDKTQLSTILLSARFGSAYIVLAGVLAALLLIVGLTILLGRVFVQCFSLRVMKWLSVALYTLGGLILLFEGVTGLELALLARS